MPGSKRRFTAEEDREADHIIESEMKRGLTREQATRIAYAHLNSQKHKAHRKKK